MKLWFNRKRIIIYSVLFVLIVVGIGLSVYYNRYSANAILDSAINKMCSTGIDIEKTDPQETKDYLEQTYGAPYPKTTGQSEFWVDMDTYAKSWQDLGLEEGRQYAKNLLPRILAEADAIYGKPYKKNRVVAVLEDSFESSQLNRSGTINTGAFSDDQLDAVYFSYDQFLMCEDKICDLETFIHEIMHAYNDGALPIQSFEEGMVEATAQLVYQKLFPEYSLPTYTENDKQIIKTNFGFFRTQDDWYLTNSRYDAATQYFFDALKQDPNYIKNFRAKYAKSAYYLGKVTWAKKGPTLSKLSMSYDPHRFTSYLLGKSVCDELTGHLPEYRAYLAYVQNLLKPGLGKYNKSAETKQFLAEYPILDVMPEEYIYPKTPSIYMDIENDSSLISIRALYKVANTKDIIPMLFKKLLPEKKLERHYNISSGFPKMMQAMLNSPLLKEDGGLSLQELGYSLEENADKLEIEVQNWADEKILLKTVVESDEYSYSYGPMYQLNIISELMKAGYKNFDGKIIVKAKAYKKIDRGVRAYNCIRFIGKTCTTTGMRFKEQEIVGEMTREFDLSYAGIADEIISDEEDSGDVGEIDDGGSPSDETDFLDNNASMWKEYNIELPLFTLGPVQSVRRYVEKDGRNVLLIIGSSEKQNVIADYATELEADSWIIVSSEEGETYKNYHMKKKSNDLVMTYYTDGQFNISLYSPNSADDKK